MRSKNSYEVRAERFIKMIAPFLISCKYLNDYYRAVRAFNARYHRAVIMKHGISRIALITSDYVIKITYDEESDFGTCEDERLMYEEAKLAGFDYLFAQITHVEYDGKDYYIMPASMVSENMKMMLLNILIQKNMNGLVIAFMTCIIKTMDGRMAM